MRAGAVALFTVLIAACATVPRTARDARTSDESGPAATQTTETTAASVDDADDADETDGDEDVDSDEGAPAPERADDRAPPSCPDGMALVAGAFCVDRYEASLVETLPDGTERPYPHYLAVDGHAVRAVSAPDVYPQGYISEVQAEEACAASGKRLCSYDEWKTACMGPARTTFPYGEARRSGVCHDEGKSAVVAVFGAQAVAASPVSPVIARANAPKKKSRPAHVTTKGKAAKTTKLRARRGTKKHARDARDAKKKPRATKRKRKSARMSVAPQGVAFNVWTQLNDARLGQVEGALSRTGEHAACANDWGVFDMVGNLHEWVATDPTTTHGTFAGGYYLDTSQNGDGCNYKTRAHAHEYHDYSTGFRCCADAKP